MRVEEQISDSFKQCLPIGLPLLNLSLRMFLNLISRDKVGSMRRLFSFPEDLIFMSLGLELTGIAGVIPNFNRFYEQDGHDPVIQGIMVSIGLLFVAFAIHWWDRTQIQPRFQNVFLSAREINKRIKRARKTKSNLSAGTWEYAHVFSSDYIFGILMWLIELAVAGYCVYYVLEAIVY